MLPLAPNPHAPCALRMDSVASPCCIVNSHHGRSKFRFQNSFSRLTYLCSFGSCSTVQQNRFEQEFCLSELESGGLYKSLNLPFAAHSFDQFAR